MAFALREHKSMSAIAGFEASGNSKESDQNGGTLGKGKIMGPLRSNTHVELDFWGS